MTDIKAHLDQLVRRQRSVLTAQLVKRFGYQHLAMIEDAIQDALVKALEKWEYDGLPNQAEAWLHRVAYHRAIDMMRKFAPEVAYSPDLDQRRHLDTLSHDNEEAEIALLLQCCHPQLKTIDQQLLMLNLVLGLSHGEIANLLLVAKDSVAQRLSRAKRKTRASQDSALILDAMDWDSTNTGTVTTALYTAFSVGYFPRQGDELVRRDIALEVLRHTETLALQCEKAGPSHQTQLARILALCALMCFQSSRFDARSDPSGQILLLKDQDNSRWDRELIQRGHQFLVAAKQCEVVSDFHIEAAIAALHLEREETDWQVVAELYQALLKLAPSPGRHIAAAVAEARSGQPKKGLARLNALNKDQMANYAPYHVARADIQQLLGDAKAVEHSLQIAQNATTSAPIASFISQQLI